MWDDIAQILGQHDPKRDDGLGKRQFVFCVDAVNENQQPKELVRQLNNLVQESWLRWPWLKIIFSARPETWRPIKRDAGLFVALYYRGTESKKLGRELEPFSYSALIEPFSYDAELPDVYDKYKHYFELQTDYGELSDEQRDTIRNPFLLLLLSITFRRKAIPRGATNSASIIEGYVAAMEEG